MRLLLGGIAAVTAAAMSVFALPTGSQAFSPVSYGLALPAGVSPADPVRIVTTTLDANGRPIFSVREATDRTAAVRIVTAARQAVGTVGVEIDRPVHALGVPSGTDTLRDLQWDLGKIHVPAAWERSTGSDVVVAVIDTGVDGAHPDLEGNVLTGYDAIEDTEGGDYDGNGHGTHVAGTVAAIAGNGEGIAGIAPDAKVLPVRVLDADGSGFSSDTAEGIVWAVDNGAQIINLSLGASTPTAAEKAAVAYAREHGVTVVAAAGNERQEGSPVSYPAAYDGVVAVAATDSRDKVGSYSNRGDYVDVSAPGSGIVSTYPAELTEDGEAYASLNGTSMAAPHVAAVAALLKAYRPEITPDGIEEVLEGTAVDLGTAGFDADHGHGRIDAAAALAALAGDGGDGGEGDGDTERVVPEVTTDHAERHVTYGAATRTTFHVTAGDGQEPLAGQEAEACVTVGGKETCSAVETGEDGGYTIAHTARGAFQARLTVPGSDTVEEASAETSYTVQAVVRATRSGKGAITVKVTGAAGQKMTLQRLVKGRWTTAKTYSATGSRKITKLVSGGSYRVVLASTPAIKGVTSGTVKA
jgi:type VII secretion-associated serine protease mycosin